MDTSYNKDKKEDEIVTLDSKPSTPDPLILVRWLTEMVKWRQQRNFWNTTKIQYLLQSSKLPHDPENS